MNDINIDVNLLFSVPIGVSNIPDNVDTLKNHILELSKKKRVFTSVMMVGGTQKHLQNHIMKLESCGIQ